MTISIIMALLSYVIGGLFFIYTKASFKENGITFKKKIKPSFFITWLALLSIPFVNIALDALLFFKPGNVYNMIVELFLEHGIIEKKSTSENNNQSNNVESKNQEKSNDNVYKHNSQLTNHDKIKSQTEVVYHIYNEPQFDKNIYIENLHIHGNGSALKGKKVLSRDGISIINGRIIQNIEISSVVTFNTDNELDQNAEKMTRSHK